MAVLLDEERVDGVAEPDPLFGESGEGGVPRLGQAVVAPGRAGGEGQSGDRTSGDGIGGDELRQLRIDPRAESGMLCIDTQVLGVDARTERRILSLDAGAEGAHLTAKLPEL